MFDEQHTFLLAQCILEVLVIGHAKFSVHLVKPNT